MRRIFALVYRHACLLRSSPIRIIELIIMPTVGLIVWGFLSNFLDRSDSTLAFAERDHAGEYVSALALLIGAALLWEVCMRSGMSFSLSFIEELWSRNLGHLFISPLTAGEWIIALALSAIVRTLIAVTPAALIVYLAFGYSLLTMGPILAMFLFNLMATGWATGLIVSACILRYGAAAEGLSWFGIFLLWPLSCVFYPLDILPDWLQPVAQAVPASSIFEAMRALLLGHVIRYDLIVHATLLNFAYFMFGVLIFVITSRRIRRLGLILQQVE